MFHFAANWDAIKAEISYSNVIQRDNLIFAKKLDKKLVAIAKEGDKKVNRYMHRVSLKKGGINFHGGQKTSTFLFEVD